MPDTPYYSTHTGAQVDAAVAKHIADLYYFGNYRAITADYTIVDEDHIIDVTAGEVVIDLPDVTSMQGHEFVIKNTGGDSGGVLLVPWSGQTIDGLADFSLGPEDYGVTIVGDGGTNWLVTGIARSEADILALINHLVDISNPHQVTASQAGALPAGTQSVTASVAITTIDFSAGSFIDIEVTVSSKTTFRASNVAIGNRYVLKVRQDATGGRFVLWDETNFLFDEAGEGSIPSGANEYRIFYAVGISSTTVRIHPDPNPLATVSESKINRQIDQKGCYFDGTTNSFLIKQNANNFSFGGGDFTLRARVRMPVGGVSQVRGIVGFGPNTGQVDGNGSCVVYLGALETIVARFIDSTGTQHSREIDFDPGNVYEGKVVEIAVSRVQSTGTVRIWINGRPHYHGQTGSGDLTDTYTPTHFHIGIGYTSSHAYLGEIYLAEVYAEAWTNAQALEVYQSGPSQARWANCKASIPLGSGIKGAVQPDVSGNDNDVTEAAAGKVAILEDRSTDRDVTASGSTTSINCGVPGRKEVDVQADTTLQATNVIEGEIYIFDLVQDSTGGWIVQFGSGFEFQDGDPILTGVADSRTIFYGVGVSSSLIRIFQDPQGIVPAIASLVYGSGEVAGSSFENQGETVATNAELPNALSKSLGLGDFTIHCRIRCDTWADGVETKYILRTPTTGNSRFLVYVTSNGNLTFYFEDSGGGSTTYIIDISSLFPSDRIFDLFLVIDRDGLASVYVDGGLIGSVDISAEADVDIGASNPNVCYIGAGGPTFSAHFVVSDYKIANFALSQSQVADIYKNGWPFSMRHSDMSDIIAPGTENGGFETAGGGGADVFASWNEGTAGTSTVNDETVDFYAGAHACRFDVDASNNSASVYRNSIVTTDKLYYFECRAKGSVNGVSFRVNNVTGFALPSQNLTTSYAKYKNVFQAVGTQISILRTSAASESIYIDEVTLKPAGLILDLDFRFGRGKFFPDRSPNRYHGIGNGNVIPLVDRTPVFHDRSGETFSTPITLDMNVPEVLLAQADEDFTINLSNVKIGAETVVHGSCDGTGRTVTLSGSYTWVNRGGALTALTANKEFTLTIKAITASKVIYSFTEEV